MYNKFQEFLNRYVGPLAEKMAANTTIQSLTNGMMSILPVSLGVAFILIVGNFPYEPWQELLFNIGLSQLIQDLITVTSGLYALYIVITIAYETAIIEEAHPITAIVLSLSFFLILVPLDNMVIDEWTTITSINVNSIGSDGIFVAMFVGLLVTKLYAYLARENKFIIKLPDSVPSMVSSSMGPTFIAMILFILAFTLKVGFHFSVFGDVLNFINTLITIPIASVGSSPLAVVFIFTFANLLWFFGVHPSPIINIFYAITAPIYIYNLNAFVAGQPQPYLEFMFITGIIMVGGTGNTIGLAISMLRAKSEKYKSLRKLTFVPSLFNINEPIIFGAPVVLNPIYFIPMVSSVGVSGLVIHLFYKLGILNYIDPTLELPWVMPPVISNFILGGLSFALVMVVVIAVLTLLYYPFFKMADNQALKEEQAHEISA